MTDNDRLLELAGGCVHVWQTVFDTENVLGRIDSVRYPVCAECGMSGRSWGHKKADMPAVGDGHIMDFGETVRLALTKINCVIIFRADGVSLYDLDENEEYWQPVKSMDGLPAALAAALLAAAGAR